MPEESPLVTPTAPSHSKRRWLILALIGLAQLMVVLDVTAVNIALPSAQKALDFSNDARQWIVTAYAVSFGSLLLVGGRVGDLIARRGVFVAGAVGFAFTWSAAIFAFGALASWFLLPSGTPAPDAPAEPAFAHSGNGTQRSARGGEPWNFGI
jgi:MFS family permease